HPPARISHRRTRPADLMGTRRDAEERASAADAGQVLLVEDALAEVGFAEARLDDEVGLAVLVVELLRDDVRHDALAGRACAVGAGAQALLEPVDATATYHAGLPSFLTSASARSSASRRSITARCSCAFIPRSMIALEAPRATASFLLCISAAILSAASAMW